MTPPTPRICLQRKVCWFIKYPGVTPLHVFTVSLISTLSTRAMRAFWPRSSPMRFTLVWVAKAWVQPVACFPQVILHSLPVSYSMQCPVLSYLSYAKTKKQQREENKREKKVDSICTEA